jgi:small-conductance mechanosensitive channel
MDAWQSHFMQWLETYGWPLLQSALVLLVAGVAYGLLARSVRKLVAAGYIDDQLKAVVTAVAKALLGIIALLLVLGFFGVSVASFWAALSGVLVLVALGFVAVWSILSNVMSSILLVVFAPFRIGDRIEIQDPNSEVREGGRVVGINLMFTTLIDDEMPAEGEAAREVVVRVPNNIFFQKYVRCLPGSTRNTRSLRQHLANQHEARK